MFPLPLKGNFTVNANRPPKLLHNDITYELHELLEYIIVHTKNVSNPEISIDLKEISKYGKLDIMPAKIFGRCYSIQLGKKIVAQGVYQIDFLSNMNLYIYFHHPGQFLSIDTKSKAYTLKGRKHFVDMTYSIMNNTLKSESTIPCSDETNFGFDTCFYQAIAKNLMNEFNCVVPFIKTSKNTNICVNKTQTKVDKIMLAFKVLSLKTTIGTCMSPCTSMDFFFGVLSDDAFKNDCQGLLYQKLRGLESPRLEQPCDGKSFLRIYFKSNVKLQETVYDYTLLSLLAEIGGYTGLFLGISVANITTVLERMFQWLNLLA